MAKSQVEIWLTDWHFKIKDRAICANGIVITGSDYDELMKDKFYIRRALFHLGIKANQHEKYTIVKIDFKRQVKGI